VNAKEKDMEIISIHTGHGYIVYFGFKKLNVCIMLFLYPDGISAAKLTYDAYEGGAYAKKTYKPMKEG
jgi:hypothetical protein